MILEMLTTKREGGVLTLEQITGFVKLLVAGEVTRAQAAAFLSFSFVNGLNDEETVAMTESGDRMTWPDLAGVFADKHSTGGVGDKVSLVLAPLWAELGVKVPMISGRGLGHTGGTLDKLESISGFRTDLPYGELHNTLESVGCFMNGQTADVAPADRILYALRNETATVPSIPLITASILSKKLAEGIDELVLDVKWGTGAFMKTLPEAEKLAGSIRRVGAGAGLKVRTRLTDMNQPLGFTVGNALEVEEAMACLKGEGPEDLAALTCDLIGHPDARAVLDSGRAFERWERLVKAHGGDLSKPLLGSGCVEEPVYAQCGGTVTRCDALDVGHAAFVLGAGRVRADAPVHFGVGVRLHAKLGDSVSKGDRLATLIHDTTGLGAARGLLERAYIIG